MRLAAVLLMAVAATPPPAAAQTAAAATAASGGWTVPRTPDGQPDLQGVWDYRTATPLERPAEFAGKEFLTDQEIAGYERRAAARDDGRPPDDPRSDPSVHPPWWLDYGRSVVGTRRSSLVVEPPDGRIPPLTADAQKRAADRRAVSRGRGPADSPEDRTLWERCITRGLPEGMLPAGYNNNVQFLQTPGYVVIVSEMIHDARIVPIDGRPHAPAAIRSWLGDSRGRWEGNTLVVETMNFSPKTNFRGAGENLRLTERFTRIDRGTIEYRFTVDDPKTWTRPWSAEIPLMQTEGPLYEYACHEANYGLAHILSGARYTEKEAARAPAADPRR